VKEAAPAHLDARASITCRAQDRHRRHRGWLGLPVASQAQVIPVDLMLGESVLLSDGVTNVLDEEVLTSSEGR
jgi:hypothetical protein